jgi:hypothetical protein
MLLRLRLPNRRHIRTFYLECNGLRYTATISRFSGELAEIVLGSGKAGTTSDCAMVASIPLSCGVFVDMVRHAFHLGHGRTSSPLDDAFDLRIKR